MDLDNEIEAIRQHAGALQKILASLEERIGRAKDAWPSHQILPAEWHDRSDVGDPQLPAAGKDEHNALSDARWTRQAWEFLVNVKK